MRFLRKSKDQLEFLFLLQLRIRLPGLHHWTLPHTHTDSLQHSCWFFLIGGKSRATLEDVSLEFGLPQSKKANVQLQRLIKSNRSQTCSHLQIFSIHFLFASLFLFLCLFSLLLLSTYLFSASLSRLPISLSLLPLLLFCYSLPPPSATLSFLPLLLFPSSLCSLSLLPPILYPSSLCTANPIGFI